LANVNSKRRLQRIQNVKMYRRRKDIRKKRYLAALVYVPSVLGEKFPTAEFCMSSAVTSCWEVERK
jgi:hypothetical protein